MANKWVREMADLRQLGNETEESFRQRKVVAKSVLKVFESRRGCRQRLYQNKGLEMLSRTPDFTVECNGKIIAVIEIGELGSVRKDEILGKRLPLIHVRRNSSFSFEDHSVFCRDCEHG